MNQVDQKKKRASDMRDWTEGYVYWSDVFADLVSLATEYIAESQHHGDAPSCDEVSSDVVDDVAEWTKRRKELLRDDFLEYYSVASEL